MGKKVDWDKIVVMKMTERHAKKVKDMAYARTEHGINDEEKELCREIMKLADARVDA